MTTADDAASSDSARRPVARTRWLWIWAAVSVVAVVIAFGIGTRVRSPWTPAIANAAAAVPVTAAVEHRTVTVDTSTPIGMVAAGATINVVPTAPSVVTFQMRSPGDPVTSGTPLTEVSGRPVIALALPFSLYRDLAPGMSGRDVSVLQRALSDLGIYHGAIDGDYGPGTADAVAKLYRRVSCDPPPASDDALAEVTSTQDAQSAASQALAAAQRALASAEEGADPAELQIAVDEAQADLATATTAASHAALMAMTPLPRAEIARIPAPAEVVSVQPTGTELTDQVPAVVLRSSSPSITVRVSVLNAPSYETGSQVKVTSLADSTMTTTGTVVVVGEFTATPTDNGDPPGYDVTVALDDLGGMNDSDEATVMPVDGAAAVEGDAVPATAIREDNGEDYVLLASEQDGSTSRRVDVTVLALSDGWAVITGDLSVGDRVVVSTGP